MANRDDDISSLDPLQALAAARSAQVRDGREERLDSIRAQIAPREEAPTAAARPAPAHVPHDPAAIAARIDLMRARFAKSRDDVVSALLFLGDAQRDCDALAEACNANRWVMMAGGVALLSDALRRALPSEPKHLSLIGLLIDALYALRRAETRPDMGRAGNDLLRGLKLAANRELPTIV